MKRFKTILAVFGIVAGAIALFVALVVAMIPDDFIYDVLRASLKEKGGVVFNAGSFKRTFGLGIKAKDVEIFTDPSGPGILGGRIKGRVLRADGLEISPVLYRLPFGSVEADIFIKIDAGSIKGRVAPGSGKASFVALKLDNIALASLPALLSLDVKAKGEISGSVDLSMEGAPCPEGSVDLAAKGLDPALIPGAPVALLFKDDFSAAVRMDIAGCGAHIARFSADNADYNVLVSGDVAIDAAKPAASRLNLNVGVTRKKASSGGFDPLSVLSQYRKSENFYSFNLKGSVERPEMAN